MKWGLGVEKGEEKQESSPLIHGFHLSVVSSSSENMKPVIGRSGLNCVTGDVRGPVLSPCHLCPVDLPYRHQ